MAALDLVVTALVRGLIAISSVVPLRPALAGGRILGLFAFHVLRFRRRVVMANLRHVLGDERSDAELRSIARLVYRNIGMTAVEILRCSGRRDGAGPETISLEHADRLLALQRAGKPIVAFLIHNGNFDLGAYGGVAHGLEIHGVMKALRSPRLTDLLVRARERRGLHVVLLRRGMFHDLEALVRQGKLVGAFVDQNARERGVPVRFLGKPASIHKGPALLHLTTGAQRVVFVFERLHEDPTRHRIRTIILPTFRATGDAEADLRACAQEMCDAAGEIVLRDPTQYFWFHRLWGKAVAAGEAREGTGPPLAPAPAAPPAHGGARGAT